MTWFAFLESNTTGTGRTFCSVAAAHGFRPVLLSANTDRYPYVADDGIDTVLVDSTDQAAVLATCERLADKGGLAGIASSSEYFVAGAARVAAKLGLPGPDADAITRCRDKAAQRDVLADNGLPVPRYRVVESAAGARAAAADIGTPVVVKPTDGSGSVGVRLCDNPSQAHESAAALLGARVNERGMPTAACVLVEEYVNGAEFSVETFDRSLIEVVGKHLGPPPYFVETGHDLPAAIPAAERAALAATTDAALAALGLGWGAAHVELRRTPQGPVVIEVNPRLAGGMIPAVLRAARGVDLIANLIAKAAGLPAPTPASGDGAGAIRFVLASEAGIVTGIPDIEAVRRLPGVRGADIIARPGDRVTISHSFKDRIGYVLTSAPDLVTAIHQAEAAASGLHTDIRS